MQAPRLPRFPPEKWEGQRLESACWEAGGQAGESLGFPEVGGGGSGPDSHPTRGRAALRSPSRPFVLQCPGRAPSPPPPAPDLLRWGRGAGAQSAEQAARPPWGQRRLARDATPEPRGQGAAVLAMHGRRPSAQESRAPALRVRKLRAPAAPERPGGEATPSPEATPRSSLLPWSRAARSARPTPSSWRQPNGEEHHRPPGETRGRMAGGQWLRMECCSDSTRSVGDPAPGGDGAQEPFCFTARLSSGSSSDSKCQGAFLQSAIQLKQNLCPLKEIITNIWGAFYSF